MLFKHIIDSRKHLDTLDRLKYYRSDDKYEKFFDQLTGKAVEVNVTKCY